MMYGGMHPWMNMGGMMGNMQCRMHSGRGDTSNEMMRCMQQKLWKKMMKLQFILNFGCPRMTQLKKYKKMMKLMNMMDMMECMAYRNMQASGWNKHQCHQWVDKSARVRQHGKHGGEPEAEKKKNHWLKHHGEHHGKHHPHCHNRELHHPGCKKEITEKEREGYGCCKNKEEDVSCPKLKKECCVESKETQKEKWTKNPECGTILISKPKEFIGTH